jgi:hypothetical protein
MRNALLSSLLAGASIAVLSVLPGCSGSGKTDSASLRIRCIGGESFCLISCDLGCTQTGCAVTEIAENQKLHFHFSDFVDPASVNGASFSLRTATGVAPDGDYLVNDVEVIFVPRVSSIGGVSTFGFLRNESYIITLAGGESAAFGIRSTSGARLAHQLTCTVRASLGVQDDDQQPPSAELISPPNLASIPLDPTIVLRFSELIDTTPLQSPLSSSSPIQVVLRGTLPTGECDTDAEGIVLTGLPQLSTELVGTHLVTVVSYHPPVTLPGLSCVTVYVTADLRDLSGRAAVPQQFQMFTEAGVSTDILITEAFTNNAQQDDLVSGGVWSNGARPALIGGDGRHGSFSPSLGAGQGSGVWLWNLDIPGGIVIPAGNTQSGQSYNVTDGRFFFTDFVLPVNTTVRFTGTVPPQIYVRGRCEIRGTIDCSAVDMPATVPTTGPLVGQRVSQYNAKGSPSSALTVGQPGGVGGPFGGSGGTGGYEPGGTSGPIFSSGVNISNGQAGQTVKVSASHAYAGLTAGTGGAGSPLTPASGLSSGATTPFITVLQYRRDFSRGGGGAGFMLAGGSPALPTIAPVTALQPVAGPVVAGGVPFPLLPFPATPPPGYQSMNHFLVGGSGGGGGGAHNFSTANLLETAVGTTFVSGAGGTGGGGAVALRAGNDLTLFSTGSVLVRGGRGVVINGDDLASGTQDVNFGVSSPGGGGSGGSAVLQSSRTVTVAGLLDASGSAGSRTSNVSATSATVEINVVSQAGAGSNGFYRLEGGTDVVFNGAVGTVPAYVPTDNRGPLNDRDAQSGDLSKWRGTNLIFPPTWLRYELDVDTDGDGVADITYTDSGDPGTQKANDPAGPLVILFQGAKIDQTGTQPIPGTIRGWREGIGIGAGPGIQQDSVTGFRFTITYNRLGFPNQVVKALRVFART